MHFASRFFDGFEKGVEDEHATDRIDEQAHLDALFRTLSEQFEDTSSNFITPDDKGGDVNTVLSLKDALFESVVSFFASF